MQLNDVDDSGVSSQAKDEIEIAAIWTIEGGSCSVSSFDRSRMRLQRTWLLLYSPPIQPRCTIPSLARTQCHPPTTGPPLLPSSPLLPSITPALYRPITIVSSTTAWMIRHHSNGYDISDACSCSSTNQVTNPTSTNTHCRETGVAGSHPCCYSHRHSTAAAGHGGVWRANE